MSSINKLLVFALSDLLCALRLSDVERVLRAVEISSVPKAPEIVKGLVNIRGSVIPVLNICKLLRLPEMEMALDDHIIIALTATRPVAIHVGNVIGVVEFNEQDILAPEELYSDIEYLTGVTILKDRIIYIYDLDRFLTAEDRSGIERLLAGCIPNPADREM